MAASSRKVRGKWRVRWRDLAGAQHWRTCPDRATALELERQIEAAHALGRDWAPDAPARRGAPALAVVTEAYLRDRARTLAPRTLTRYAEALDQLLLFAGPRTVADMSRQLLADGWIWLAAPEQGRHGRARSAETVRQLIEVWSLCWEWAHDHDEFGEHTPRPRRIETPRRTRSSPTAPTWADVDAMLAELDRLAPAWACRLAWLARFTGERRSALLQVRWSDLDLNRAALTIPDEVTKGGYGGRVVPLHDQLLAALRDWPREGPTIVAAPAAELTGRGHCDRTLRRAWRRAGVPESRWQGQPLHAMRKTVRTWLAAQAVAADVIDAFLGHAGQGSGGRYYTDRAHLWPALVEAVKKIPPIVAVEGGSTTGSRELPS